MTIYQWPLISILITGCFAVHAQAIYSPPNGFYIGDPDRANRVLYGATNTSAKWYISQWGTPGNRLPAFKDGVAATVNHRVAWSDGKLEIALSGKDLPCLDSDGHPKEFDGFASPNDGGWYTGYPIADPAPRGSSRSLAAMRTLIHRIGLTDKHFEKYDDACGNTSGNHITSFTIKNTFDNSTFYYQLRLKILVGVDRAPNGVWSSVSGQAGGASLFSDNLKYYGEVAPALGHRKLYTLDLLPRLRALIQACRRRVADSCVEYIFPDRNLSHWYVKGAYHGTNIWGHINTTAVWDSFSLVEN
jgi:hypothetical protein